MPDNKRPIILYIDPSDSEAYRALAQEELFLSVGNTRLFLLAMSVGYSSGLRMELSSRTTYTRSEYLSEHERALIDCLAVAEEGNAEVLMDYHKVHRIAEEYAHGGVHELLRAVRASEFGSYDRVFETQTQDIELRATRIGQQ